MAKWFLTKVKYMGEDAKGDPKEVTEANLVDALSYTEAEAIITGLMAEKYGDDFAIDKVDKWKISHVIYDPKGYHWWKVKAVFESMDDVAGRSKKISEFSLVQANDMKEALKKSLDNYGDSHTMEIDYILKTVLVDVIPYTGPDRPSERKKSNQISLDFDGETEEETDQETEEEGAEE